MFWIQKSNLSLVLQFHGINKVIICCVLTYSRVIWLELLISHFLIKFLTATRQQSNSYTSTVKESSDNIRFLILLSNTRKPICAICLNFSSKKINPCKNYVEADFHFNQMKSAWKFLSVKTRIIGRGVFRTHSSSYHGDFFEKKC